MKYLRFVVPLAALVPSLVHAQNQQFSDCHTLEAAGNFVGVDEALVNGLVCKVRKPKTNSAASTQVPEKAADRSPALLGIIEPKTLRSTDKTGASSVGTALAPEAAPGSAASDSTPGRAPKSSFFEKIPEKSLGEIARAYRKEARTDATTEAKKGASERRKPTNEVERGATPSLKTLPPATVAEFQPAPRTQARPAAESPAAPGKTVIITAAPATVPSTPAEAPRSAKNEVIAVPQKQPSGVNQETSPATAGSLHEPAVKVETNSPAMVTTSASAPEVQAGEQTEIVASPQRTPAKEQTPAIPMPSAKEQALEFEPERSSRVGVFAVSQPPATNPLPQLLANTTTEDTPFKEGQLPTCIKNVSLGSLEKEKLFLAIPDWALKWYEKNQKRFPGICLSDSLMPGAHNYLVVFYTAAPLVAGTESLAKISAAREMTPGSGMGGFTTSYGHAWHYTYDRTVTTTITSLSAEKAPHNQPSTLLYATAYSEQGIPISHHWPSPVTKPDIKKTANKPGKSHDVALPEFRRMEELLSQMVADIAKL
jgi:hypothetical protein